MFSVKFRIFTAALYISPLPRFPPITCSAYLSQRYKDTHADLKSYDDSKA